MSTTQEFFAQLDKRFVAASEGEVLWLDIRGYRVRVEFRGMLPSDITRINLKLLLADPVPWEDERLCVWQDKLDDLMEYCMVPKDQQRIHYHQTDEYHLLIPGSSRRLSARDNASHTTYICYERGCATPETCATKPFTNELQWWLWDEYLLMHSAAVGTGRKGALIIAPSGGGKSTLSLAALVEGMECVGEDFVLIPRTGDAVGYSLFPTGNLLPDTLETLPELRGGVLTFMERRNKYVVDLALYSDRFVEQLPLDVMVYPVICGADEPSIVPTKSVQRFMTAAVSAAKQVKSRERLADSVKAISARLKTIPAYEMYLTSDTKRNVEALRAFLAKLDR